MLPAGVLAKHGYTTQWGFFSGTCRGSGHPPFEVSCDLIKTFVATAQDKLADFEAFKAALLARPAAGTTEAWVHVYRSSHVRRGLNGYSWMLLPIHFVAHQSEGRIWWSMQYPHPDKTGMHRLDLYGTSSADPLDYVAALNQKRAQALEAEIDQVRRYITWQTGRVATWKRQSTKQRDK